MEHLTVTMSITAQKRLTVGNSNTCRKSSDFLKVHLPIRRNKYAIPLEDHREYQSVYPTKQQSLTLMQNPTSRQTPEQRNRLR